MPNKAGATDFRSRVYENYTSKFQDVSSEVDMKKAGTSSLDVTRKNNLFCPICNVSVNSEKDLKDNIEGHLLETTTLLMQRMTLHDNDSARNLPLRT